MSAAEPTIRELRQAQIDRLLALTPDDLKGYVTHSARRVNPWGHFIGEKTPRKKALEVGFSEPVAERFQNVCSALAMNRGTPYTREEVDYIRECADKFEQQLKWHLEWKAQMSQ